MEVGWLGFSGIFGTKCLHRTFKKYVAVENWNITRANTSNKTITIHNNAV